MKCSSVDHTHHSSHSFITVSMSLGACTWLLCSTTRTTSWWQLKTRSLWWRSSAAPLPSPKTFFGLPRWSISRPHATCWYLIEPTFHAWFMGSLEMINSFVEPSVFCISPVILCMATSALAPAGPVFCSFIALLPPSEQAQHFKSCFPAAGRKLSSLFSMRCSRKGHSSYFCYWCLSTYFRLHTYVLRILCFTELLPNIFLYLSLCFTTPVFPGNTGSWPGVLWASERPAGQRLTSDSERPPKFYQVNKSHFS